MSEVMLYGVLEMPYELAMSDELARRQYHDRGQQAAAELRRLHAENERLRGCLYDIAEHDHDLKCPNRPYEWIAMLRGCARAALAKETT